MERDLSWIKEEQWKNMNRILQFQGTSEEFAGELERIAGHYPMYCAWCLPEGKKTITGYSSVEHSSGICERHNAELMEEIHEVQRI